MSRRVLSALAVATVLVAGTGCGVNGTGFRPGVAADVGDQRIYTEDIDPRVDVLCDYFTDRGGGQAFPKADLRTEVLRLDVQRAAVEQLLEDQGLDAPPVSPESVQAFLDQYFRDPPARFEDGVTEIAERSIEVQSGLIGVGAQLLQDEGAQVDPAQQQDAALQRGLEELALWMQDNDVELNPVFGLLVDDDGQITSDSSDTSVVVSDEARFGIAPEAGADPAEGQQKYLDDLPASQTCG